MIDFLVRDPDNPSSIIACVNTARQSARSVRSAINSDTWEAINTAWLESQRLGPADFGSQRINDTLDWVKTRALWFNGAYTNTLMRNDIFYFLRLGTFIERADNTARILDVKYHILLPDHEPVGGIVDYYQWASILRAVSALRSYHRVYKDRIQPWNVAELLLLRPEMPRSLRACFDQITQNLDLLADAYGGRAGECHRLAGELHARLRYGRIDTVFQDGLHRFLIDYIDQAGQLGEELHRFYLM